MAAYHLRQLKTTAVCAAEPQHSHSCADWSVKCQLTTGWGRQGFVHLLKNKKKEEKEKPWGSSWRNNVMLFQHKVARFITLEGCGDNSRYEGKKLINYVRIQLSH